MGRIVKESLFITLLFMMGSCAQMVSPQGGPKDITPPKPVSYKPVQPATNFSEKQFEVEFNEYIQLNDLNKNLFISPPLKEKPEVIAKLRKLKVSFKDTLESNTTYTFMFGSAIADVNEGNKLENFVYALSTGQQIDTITLSGKVRLAETLKEQKEGVAMLFKKNKFSLDSFPYKYKPSYITLIKDDGTFQFKNIAKGEYRLLALHENDNDLKFSTPDEKIAFLPNVIKVDSNLTNLNLYMFTEEKVKQYIKQVSPIQFGKAIIVMNKPLVAPIEIEFLEKKPRWTITEYRISRDTVDVWFEGNYADSAKIKISSEQFKTDTFSVKLMTNKSLVTGKGKDNVSALTMQSAADISNPLDFYKPLDIKFSHPLSGFDTKKIILTNRKDTVLPDVSILDNAGRVIRISISTFKEDSLYTLYFMKGAFIDLFGLQSDSTVLNFKVTQKKSYGELKLNIKTRPKKPTIIVELLDSKLKVANVGVIQGAGLLIFNQVREGKYTLRIFEDDNGNGLWNPGKFIEGRMPERVFIPKDDVMIKGNWENEVSIDLNTFVE